MLPTLSRSRAAGLMGTGHRQRPDRRTLTFGAAQSHGEGAVALVQLPEAGAARVVADHRQLPEDQGLVGEGTRVVGLSSRALLLTHAPSTTRDLKTFMQDIRFPENRGFRALGDQDALCVQTHIFYKVPNPVCKVQMSSDKTLKNP